VRLNAFNLPDGEVEVSLGLLVSNHAGYLAFDLSSKKNSWFDEVTAIHAEVPIDPPLSIDLTDQLTVPFTPELLPISLPERLADSKLASRGLNSIQNPDIDDWLFSPGSFGADAVPIIGENGCEVLLPSHAAERIIRFHQIIRTPDSAEFPPTINFSPEPSYEEAEPSPEADWPRQLYYKTGELHHYEMVWLPLNHGLGKVLYSLTLAPCEAVRIAVVDWSRSEEAGRTEQVSLSDDLVHSLRRDRTIEEVVNAVLRERQSGESFLGGTAGVGGYGGGFGGGGMGLPTGGGSEGGSGGAPASNSGGGQQAGQNWGVTGSHSIGYALANSSGSRDVDVETTQDLIDEIAQASHLVRDLRSTVIVQADQRERETVQTRIVRNHNHSHALTVLYYEVVRHYLVRSLRRRVQPAIFIKYPTLTFDEATAYKYRHLLTGQLRAQHLINYFDALIESLTASNNDVEYFNNASISDFVVTVTASDDSIDNLDRLQLQVLSAGRATTIDLRFPSGNVRQFTTRTLTLPNTDVSLRYRDILQLGLFYSVEGDGDYRERASVQGFDVKAVMVLDEVSKLFDLLSSSTYYKFENTSTFWQHPNRKRDASTLSIHDAEQRQKIDELITHLTENRHHYSALICLQESPHERAARFEHYLFNGIPLIEAIDNRPIDVVGNYVVFPLAQNPSSREAEVLAERIISMPTRGAFAEAKLSHCNASEVIDDTRFWDWQISPCPDEPTEIAPITLGSRRSSPGAAPSTLPSPGVSISDPPSAPEPFGMREVMELLRTPEIFRDMSGIDELGSLLEKLVEVAGEVEKARIGATTELASADSEASTNQPSRQSSPPASSTNSRQRLGQSQVAQRGIQRALDRGLISHEQARDLSFRSLDNAFTDSSESSGGLFSGVNDSSTRPEIADLLRTATYDGSDIWLQQGEDSVRVQRVGITDDGGSSEWWNDPEIAVSYDEIEICIPFHPEYAEFRRRVAGSEEIGTRMISRSDREYPEQVIDRRPDLQDIHAGFNRVGIEEGQTVCLLGYIVRDVRRYVLLIRFATRDILGFPDEPIDSDLPIDEIVRNAISHARRVAESIPQEQPRLRILCLIALAERLGVTRSLELYTVDSLYVAIFLDMSDRRMGDELRDGIPPERSKYYPIRQIAFLIYYQESYRNSDERFREALIQLDANIYRSIWLFQRVLASGSSVYGPNFYRLRDWVRIQQENSNSVYSCYAD
jgi:hypothetical protein